MVKITSLWYTWEMISISVLGCGWLGLPLAQRLVNQGYLVKGSSTRQSLIVELKKSNIRDSSVILSIPRPPNCP